MPPAWLQLHPAPNSNFPCCWVSLWAPWACLAPEPLVLIPSLREMSARFSFPFPFHVLPSQHFNLHALQPLLLGRFLWEPRATLAYFPSIFNTLFMPLAVDIDSEDFLGLSYGLFFLLLLLLLNFFLSGWWEWKPILSNKEKVIYKRGSIAGNFGWKYNHIFPPYIYLIQLHNGHLTLDFLDACL